MLREFQCEPLQKSGDEHPRDLSPLKKNQLYFAVVGPFMKKALSTIILVLIILGLIGLHAWLLEGLVGSVFARLLKSDTAFAVGYSDPRFRSIDEGAKAKYVFDTLGPPLESWQRIKGRWKECSDETAFSSGSSVLCSWSYSPSDTNYHVRRILFKRSIVLEKYAEFYVD